MAKEKITVLRVAALRPGFRRAGFVFGTEPKDIPVSTLSKKQHAAIIADRMLVASEVQVETEVDVQKEPVSTDQVIHERNQPAARPVPTPRIAAAAKTATKTAATAKAGA